MRIEISPGHRLYVDITGFGQVPHGPTLQDKPVLLCLHGGPGFDHSSFKPAFSALADITQVVVYDHRGHGRSDRRPRDEWTLDTWADDVVRLCDALGVTMPIVLGQSFGGFVAQRYLARHPAHPAKVILSSTSAAFNLPRKLAMFERLGGPAARDLAERFWQDPTPQNMADYLRELMPLYNPTPSSDPDSGARKIAVWEILDHFVRTEMPSMDLAPGLAKAQCPVLVLAGEDDPVCPLADAKDIAQALPERWRQFVSLPGCGHGTWRDRPEAAFAVLREFIQS